MKKAILLALLVIVSIISYGQKKALKTKEIRDNYGTIIIGDVSRGVSGSRDFNLKRDEKLKPVMKLTPDGKLEIMIKDTADVYRLSLPQAALVYQTLESYKKSAVLSPDVSARDLNLKLLPIIDSCQRILYNQMVAFEKQKKEKAKADSLKRVKSK